MSKLTTVHEIQCFIACGAQSRKTIDMRALCLSGGQESLAVFALEDTAWLLWLWLHVCFVLLAFGGVSTAHRAARPPAKKTPCCWGVISPARKTMLSGALLKGGVRKSLPVLPVSRLISCLARASQGQVIVVVGCASKCLAACLCEHGTRAARPPAKKTPCCRGVISPARKTMLSGALLKGGVRKSLPVLPVSRLISCLARASGWMRV